LIRALYLVRVSQPYKLAKLLSKFGISVRPYPCRYAVKDKGEAVEVEILVQEQGTLGELNRRLKHIRPNCEFKLLEVSNFE
jgi:hypothetical protein